MLAVPDYSVTHFAQPTIMQVLRLIQVFRPNTPTPALDQVWKTKGLAGSKADLEAYWDDQRAKPEPAGTFAVEKEMDNEM